MEQRIFPPVSSRLYETSQRNGAAPDEQVALAILELSRREYPLKSRLLRHGQRPATVIGMLLAHHRCAFEAEVAAQWRRADFYWSEFAGMLESVWSDVASWDGAAEEAAREAGMEVRIADCRGRLLREVFVETHAAFYRAIVKREATPCSCPRADFHLRRQAALMRIADCGEDSLRAALSMLEERVNVYGSAKEWKKGLPLAQLLAASDPSNWDFQDLVIYFEHSMLMSSVSNLSGEQAERALGRGMEKMEMLRQRYPRHTGIYRALGSEHHLRAVHQANCGLISSALEEAAKAAAFDSTQDALQQASEKLTEMMHRLQEHMRTVMNEIRSRPNARLNADGERMKTQADRGFEPARLWSESEAAGAIRTAVREAYVCTTWRHVGLAEPAKSWPEKAEQLVAGLSEVIRADPKSASSIAYLWQTQQADRAELEGVESLTVCSWLNRRLLGAGAPATAPIPAYCDLELASIEPQKGEEPLAHWLASRSGGGLKAQIALACVLAILAGGLTWRNNMALQTRNHAWREMQTAAAQSDDAGVIAAGERYFSWTNPRGEEKGRESAAAEIYSRAVIRWCARQPEPLSAEALRRIRSYKARVVGGGYLESSAAGGVL